MGTWGPDIFENDTAADLAAAYREQRQEGKSAEQASQIVLEKFSWALNDPDEAPGLYLALANLQLDEGLVVPEVRAKALAVITSGQAMKLWEEAEEADREKRRQLLANLQSRLTS